MDEWIDEKTPSPFIHKSNNPTIQQSINPELLKRNPMKTYIYRIITFIISLMAVVTAQPSFPSAPNQAPIGGLGLLAAAGGALALKKLRDKHKK